MTNPEDPRLRFRIWVDAQLVDEVWIDTSNPEAGEHVDAARARHAAIATVACMEERLWVVEMFDPGAPRDEAYRRFGTDAAGMIEPRRWEG